MALSDKQKAFCREYMEDYNATAAAIRVGYSPKTAQSQASQLMKRECVVAEIERLKAEESKRTGVTKERIMRELAKIAFVDPMEVLDEDGGIREGVSAHDRAGVNRIKVRRYPDGSTEREAGISDKTKALELLGKMCGAFEPKKANAFDLDGAKVRGLVILPDVEAESEPIEVVEDDESEA